MSFDCRYSSFSSSSILKIIKHRIRYNIILQLHNYIKYYSTLTTRSCSTLSFKFSKSEGVGMLMLLKNLKTLLFPFFSSEFMAILLFRRISVPMTYSITSAVDIKYFFLRTSFSKYGFSLKYNLSTMFSESVSGMRLISTRKLRAFSSFS